MIDEFETVTNNGTLKNRITLTQTMLLEILRNVEIYSNNRNISVRVYHDSLRGYSEIFKEVEEVFFKEEPPIVYNNNDVIWLSRFPHIKSITVRNSIEEPCIQAADLMCGFTSKYFYLVSQMSHLKKIEKELLKSLVTVHDLYIKEKATVWNWYAPYNFERKFILSLNPKAKMQAKVYHMIIKRDFDMAIKNNRRWNLQQNDFFDFHKGK